MYKAIKTLPRRCNVPAEIYLEFGKRAYLAGDNSASIWSLQKGIEISGKKNMPGAAEFHYFLGLAYLSKDRLEEAIAALRTVVFDENPAKIDPAVLQKSHMALLQTYYQREKSHDRNVKYLMELFKTRYKTSPYLYSIRQWNSHKYSMD